MDVEAISARLQESEQRFEDHLIQTRLNFVENAVNDQEAADQNNVIGPYTLINDVANRQALMIAFTGFSIHEFSTIFNTCQRELDAGSRGRQPTFVGKDALLVTLTFLKHYQTFEKLSVDFRISVATLERCIERTMESIYLPLKRRFLRVFLHDEQLTLGLQPESFPDAVGIIDCTVQECGTPVAPFADKKLFFSGKHWMYCLKTLTLHAPNGLAMLFHSPSPGSRADIDVLVRSANIIAPILTANNVQRTYHLIGDAGFQGASNIDGLRVVTPYKHPPRGNLTEDQLEFNRELSRVRVIVENFYGRLKTRFGAARLKYRGDRSNYKMQIEILLALINYDIYRRPLRREEGLNYLALMNEQIEKNRISHRQAITARRAAANRRRQRLAGQLEEGE